MENGPLKAVARLTAFPRQKELTLCGVSAVTGHAYQFTEFVELDLRIGESRNDANRMPVGFHGIIVMAAVT